MKYEFHFFKNIPELEPNKVIDLMNKEYETVPNNWYKKAQLAD